MRGIHVLGVFGLLVSCLIFADSQSIYDRLMELGYSTQVARAIAENRRDLHGAIQADAESEIATSKFRPVRLYRGIDVVIEAYDAEKGRGPTMLAQGVRHLTSLKETAIFYAGLVAGFGEIKARLNTGIVLELEVPASFVERGALVATTVSLEKIPNEAIFTKRIGLGHLSQSLAKMPAIEDVPHDVLSQISRFGRPKRITWFMPYEVLKGGLIKAPHWPDDRCVRTLVKVTNQSLSNVNPFF